MRALYFGILSFPSSSHDSPCPNHGTQEDIWSHSQVFPLFGTTNLADTREGSKASVPWRHPHRVHYIFEFQRYGIELPAVACGMPYHDVDTDMVVAVVATLTRFALYANVALVSMAFLLIFVRAHFPPRIANLTPFGLAFLCLDPGRSTATTEEA